MASTHLSRTPSSTTNRKTYTFSTWVKFSTTSTSSTLLNVGPYNSSKEFRLTRNTSGTLEFYDYNGSSYEFRYRTNRLFRDVSAWYHIVCAVDTTNGTSGDRVKIYVNGVQETSFDVSTAPSQNLDTNFNVNNIFYIGGAANGNYIEGSMSHINFTDGTAYDASAFGSTDATTGEWVGNTSPSVTYGTNGFFILKDGNSVTDQSGNSNNFTVAGGTLTDLKDNPDNVFATMNPLNSYWSGGTFSNGNNTVVLPNKNGAWNTGTLGMTSGKYYWEIKCTGTSNGEELQMGIADKSPIGNSSAGSAGTSFGKNSNGEYGIYGWNGGFIGNAVANPYTSYGSSTANGIAMFAVDLDNNKFYGGVNGTWFASGNPATGANGKTIQAVADTVDGCYYPAISTYQGYTGTTEVNFGNGYFGTTVITTNSGNGYSGAEGSSKFNYTVPTGYSALSTKGLNE